MPPPHPALAPARLPVPEGSTVLLSLPQPRVASCSCSLALTFAVSVPPGKKTSPPCLLESLRVCASAPSSCPYPPLSHPEGEKSRYSAVFLLPRSGCLCPAFALGVLSPGASALFAPSGECHPASHGIRTRRLPRRRKHLLQAGRRLPRHSAPPFPSPADHPTFPRRPFGGCPEAPPGRPARSREETPSASAAIPSLVGAWWGSSVCPRRRWGPKATTGEGRVCPHSSLGSPGKSSGGAS